MDSRLWHATAPNQTQEPRVALAIRYAPWWLNLEVLRPDSAERRRMCSESGQDDNRVPSVPNEVYSKLPGTVQPLFQHWREGSG
jgi:ectoine hydroxylase-related dioxygenase (phytanoyl-CoA dioxygenase family)